MHFSRCGRMATSLTTWCGRLIKSGYQPAMFTKAGQVSINSDLMLILLKEESPGTLMVLHTMAVVQKG